MQIEVNEQTKMVAIVLTPRASSLKHNWAANVFALTIAPPI